MPEIEVLLEHNKFEPKDLRKILVVVGPGGYTGLRVGVMVAKILASSLAIPIAGITNPQLLAKRFQESKKTNKLFVQWPLNRGYFFVQKYEDALLGNREGEVLSANEVGKIEGDFIACSNAINRVDLKPLEETLTEIDQELVGDLGTVQPFYAVPPAISVKRRGS